MPATTYHKVEMSSGPWDGGLNEKNLREGESASYYESAYMYRIDGADATKKSSYKLPYREVSSDGDVGEGNVKACQSIVGILNGAMGGADIPADAKVTILANAEKHLADAGLTVKKSVSIYKDDSVYLDSNIYKSTDNQDSYLKVNVDVEIKKSTDEGLVSGWANVAINKDGSIPLDWQGDVIDPETLEKAAIDFMLDYRGSGEMHQGLSKGTVVESIVLTKAKQEILGIPPGTVPEGWFITVKVLDPEVFAKVKSGEYKMFSIQGRAKRVKL
jgi:hypothetical protein